MSFNQLPDELVAHFATFLDFSDVCKLRQTQKRISKILTAYHLTGPACYNLTFSKRSFVDEKKSEMKLTVINEPAQQKEEDVEVRELNESNDEVKMIFEYLAKYRYVEILVLSAVEINPIFFNQFLRAKIQIRNLVLDKCVVLLEKLQVIQLFSKFKKVSLDYFSLHAEYMNDELIGEIIKNTEFVGIPEMPKLLLPLPTKRALTDKIIHEMGQHPLPKNFRLDGLPTSFSVLWIIRLVRLALHMNHTGFHWNFGILKREEHPLAIRLMFEIINMNDKSQLCLDLHRGRGNGLMFVLKHKRNTPFMAIFETE